MTRFFVINLYKFHTLTDSFTINLKAKPGASCDKIEGFIEIEEKSLLKISVKAQAEDGKANKAIIKLLSKSWKIPQSNLEIIKGSTSNNKVLTIKNISEAALKVIFSTYIN